MQPSRAFFAQCAGLQPADSWRTGLRGAEVLRTPDPSQRSCGWWSLFGETWFTSLASPRPLLGKVGTLCDGLVHTPKQVRKVTIFLFIVNSFRLTTQTGAPFGHLHHCRAKTACIFFPPISTGLTVFHASLSINPLFILILGGTLRMIALTIRSVA